MLGIGLAIMLYPTVSDWWNSFHQSRAVASYQEAMAEFDESEYEALFAAADTYNEHLRGLSFPFTEYEQLDEEYTAALDINGSGIMGTVTIPSINVQLPIYHGTSDSVLNVAAGHIEGTTLPVGGPGTHGVISAHRGLPSARLFTDLNKVVEGDLFMIDVLNRTFTYQVDRILIVEPDQLEALNIEQGMDYVTLQTCTPYGINTHRILVRGHRVDNLEVNDLVITPDAVRVARPYVMLAVGLPLLILTILFLLFGSGKPRKSHKQLLEELKNQPPDPGSEPPEQ